MADKKIEIKVGVSVDGAGASNLASLKKTISDLQKETANLELGSEAFEDAKNKIDALKASLKELSKSQSQLDKELANTAAKAEAEAEALASERQERITKLGDNLEKLAKGATDAFAGAFIALGASEASTEEFNKTLAQGIGIATGVKGAIEGLIAGVQLAAPAFESLNAVIAANPIAATVIAVAALSAGIYLLVKAINAEESESEKLTKSLEKQKAAAELLKAANANEVAILEAKQKLLTAQGASDEAQLASATRIYEAKKKGLEQDLLQLELSSNISQAKLKEVEAEDSLTQAYYKQAIAIAKRYGTEEQVAALQIALDASKAESSKEARDQAQKDLIAVNELRTKLTSLDLEQQATVATTAKKIGDDQKKLAADLLEGRQKDLNDQKAKYEEQVKEAHGNAKLLEEAAGQNRLAIYEINAKYNKAEKEQRDAAIKQQEIDEQAASDYLASIDKKAANERQALIDADVNAVKRAEAEKLNATALAEAEKERLRKKAYEDAKILTVKIVNDVNMYAQAIGATLNNIVGVFDAVNQLQQQKREQELKAFQDNTNAQLSSLEQGKDAELAKVGLTEQQKADINNKYAEKEYQLKLEQYYKETEVKKAAFNADKKLRIAQTIISTATGSIAAVVSAFQSPLPFPVAAILGALSAAAIVATGAIQIATIKNTNFDSGTPPPPPTLTIPSASSIGTGGNSDEIGPVDGPRLSRIGRTDANGSDSGNNSNGGQVFRAYVTTEDINSAQNQQAVIERRRSF
jgi:hypothetical protein